MYNKAGKKACVKSFGASEIIDNSNKLNGIAETTTIQTIYGFLDLIHRFDL